MIILAKVVSAFSLLIFALGLIATLFILLKELGVLKGTSKDRENAAETDFQENLPTTDTVLSKSKATRILLIVSLLAVCTRIFICLVGYMGVMLIQKQAGDSFSSFQFIWNKWDADHYLFIAENWYVTTGDKRFLIVFYPFYPLVIRFFHLFINNYFWSGMLVSNISLVAACFYLYRLTEMDFGDDVPLNSVKYLLLFPVSFFLGATFSESLFILLSIMTLYYARKERWLIACICGMLAAFTRSLGVLLVIPVFVEYLVQCKVVYHLRGKAFKIVLKDFLRKGLSFFLIPFGTLLYLWVNKSVTGDWLKFLEYQKDHWSQSFGLFFANMETFVLNAASWKPEESVSLWIPQIIIILCAMVLLLCGFRKIRASYMVYFFVYLFVSISPTWLLSGPRYVMSIFPIYMILALLSKNKVADILLTSVSVLLLAFCTLAYVTGHPIM